MWQTLASLALINLVCFGNGNVMLAPLQRTFVNDSHALTSDQLLFAYALANVTPGQTNLYVAAIGYMMFGVAGAVLSLVVIAAPSFLMIPLLASYRRFQGNQVVGRFTRGLASASVGLLFTAIWNLGHEALTVPVTWIVLGLGLMLMLAFRLPTLVGLLAATGIGLAVALVAPALA